MFLATTPATAQPVEAAPAAAQPAAALPGAAQPATAAQPAGAALAQGQAVEVAPAVPSPVLPADTPDLWEKRPVAVEAQIALLGSPIGLLGGNIDYAPSRRLSLTAGAGVGGGLASALQVSFMMRLRWPLREETAFSVGLGLSGGGYRPVLQGLFREGYYSQSVWDRALWVNAEVGFDIRPRPLPGVVLRPMLGLSNMLNPGDERCQQVSDGKLTGPVEECLSRRSSDGFWSRMRLPYVGLALGYALSL